LVIIGVVSLFDLWTVNKRYLNDDNYVDKIFAENPFQTESSDLMAEKVQGNPNLEPILANVNVNKTLETIEKDKTHYRIFNNILGTFSETNTSYFKSSIGGYHAVKLRRYDDVINEYFQIMDSVKVPNILNLLNAKYLVLGGPEQPQAMPNPKANGNAWFVSDLKFVESPNQKSKQSEPSTAKEPLLFPQMIRNISTENLFRQTQQPYQFNEISTQRTGI
jgi:hypothetical protein